MKRFIFILATLISFNCLAQGRVLIGIGVSTCKEYIDEKDENLKLHYASWMGGYLTALNMQRMQRNEKTINLPSQQELNAMLQLQCIRNKDESV